MLDTFVADYREEIIRRCQAKVDLRSTPTAALAEIANGVPRFLDQLVDALRQRMSSHSAISESAARHGRDLHQQGFTVSQVVHGYGDVCQAITDLALQLEAPVSVEDFRTLNGCLDDAIASAVTEFGRGNQSVLDAESEGEDERLGFLAHEIRNLVGTASVAFEVLRTGNVGVVGSTGDVLLRTLAALRDLVTRSVADVRRRHDAPDRTPLDIAEFLGEIASAAALDAFARGVALEVQAGAAGVTIAADRPILAAAVTNLLQNAFKFTRPGTTVTLRWRATDDDRVLIEVEDECGGLPAGDVSDLFQPYKQHGADRTGLGLGLAISRWGADVNDGRISARSLPHRGCVFTIDLPRLAMHAVAPSRQ